MSAKAKILLTLMVVVVWIVGSGMSNFQSPRILSKPQVIVTAVVQNKTVQFNAQKFRPNTYFEILIGAFGTRGVNGVKVGTAKTTSSGEIRTTVSIPSRFKGANKLDLRIQLKGYKGESNPYYFAYTTFINRTTATTPPQKHISLRVIKIIRNKSVTVKYIKLPPNLRFEVSMTGLVGKQKYTVGKFSSGAGGTLTDTYRIPRTLVGNKIIFLIVRSTTQGYVGMTLIFN